MNDNFKKGRQEFKQKNYKKALDNFDKIKEDDMDYKYALVFKANCLIELKQYRDALMIVNSLIEEEPYDELLWLDKVTCHIFLKEEEKAYAALEEVERIIDPGDKSRLMFVAKFYNLLGDDEKALKFCNDALAIDENFKDALYEKALVAIRLEDDEMIDEIADKILEISHSNNIINLTPIFLLKLFSKNYRGCLDIIENSADDEVKDETITMFKAILFKQMCEDLNAQILTIQDNIELSVDDALQLMFEFHDVGKDFGEVHGVRYMIL